MDRYLRIDYSKTTISKYLIAMILVWDTGASYGLTRFRRDFINDVKCDLPAKDMPKMNRVIGIVTNIHKFIDSNGQYIFLPCISYHLTQTYVRLFSPHTYHQMNGGNSVLKENQVTINLPFNRIQIPIDIGRTYLPMVHNSFVTEHQKRAIGPQMRSSLD